VILLVQIPFIFILSLKPLLNDKGNDDCGPGPWGVYYPPLIDFASELVKLSAQVIIVGAYIVCMR